MAKDSIPEEKIQRASALIDIALSASQRTSKNRTNPAQASQYRLLRNDLMHDPETTKLVPHFIRSCPDLRQLRRAIKGLGDTWQTRRLRVEAGIQPLRRWLKKEAQTSDYLTIGGDLVTIAGEPILMNKPSAEPVVHPLETRAESDEVEEDTFAWTSVEPPLEDNDEPAVASPRPTGLGRGLSALLSSRSEDVSQSGVPSSSWTGRVTRKEQARVVISIAPAALEGVKAMLAEHERGLHNRPPEAIEEENIQALRDLHRALGELIELAEAGRGLERQIKTVTSLSGRVFGYMEDIAQLSVRGLKPTLASAPVVWGTWLLLGLISSPATLATLGPALAGSALAGYFAVDQMNRPMPRSRKRG